MEIEFSKKTLFLNEEQSRAVTRKPNLHQRILAGAGSGKTTTLTARIAWLIEFYQIDPASIVLLTFSRNAAQQMKKRIDDLIGPSELYVGTFHGLSKQLLRKHCPRTLQKLYFIDELIHMGIQWFESEAGQWWTHSIRYVVVDEFQDINHSQWKFLQKILHPEAFLIIVGDDAQNIYTWRGSNVDYILNLHKEFPTLVDDQLRMNYRSSSAIVACANGILKHIPSLPWKQSMIAQKQSGMKPQVHFFWRSCDETSWVLKTYHEIQELQPTWTFAVVSRTNNDLYRIEEALQSKGILYRLKDVVEDTEKSKTGILDLVTLHASKGLEWDCVFFINCNDDCFPTRKNPSDILCERRLFYVGVTRAKSMLFFTYTKKERSLTRFIREIPNVFLQYMGLARYTLSDIDRAEGRTRLLDILSALDGEHLQTLRKQEFFQPIEKEFWKTYSLFPNGLWRVPKWAIGYDRGGDFYRFLRLWIYRHLWSVAGGDEPFHEPGLERILFTLRVYAEEKEFFELWRTEIIEMFHAWFAQTKTDPPAVEFADVNAWAKEKSIPWSPQDIVTVTTILAKLRGQLRPLRFNEYELEEFRVGSCRYIVPTEWRGEVLKSWRKVTNRSVHWKDCLVDIWRLGALALCAEGRNAALYRVIDLSKNIESGETIEFLEMLERTLCPWISSLEGEMRFGIELANTDIYTEQIDILQGQTIWRICLEEREDALRIFELAVRATLARQESIPIQKIGWIVPMEGVIATIELPDSWHSNVETYILKV